MDKFVHKSLQWLSEPIHVFCLIFSFIPLTALVFFVWTFGRSAFPMSDMMAVGAPIAIKVYDRNFVWQDLFIDHNGHRLPLYFLLIYFSTNIAHWNVRIEVVIILVLGLCNALILVSMFSSGFSNLAHWILVPFSLLTLSIDMGMSWLIGIFIQWFLSMFFILMSLWIVQRFDASWTTLLTACGCIIAAMLVLANGFLGWFLLLIHMIVRQYRKPSYFVVVVILMIATTLPFLLGSLSAEGGNSDVNLSISLTLFVQYLLAFMGRPLASPDAAETAQILGGSLLFFFLVNLVVCWKLRIEKRNLVPWLLLLLYVMGSAVVITVARYEPHTGFQPIMFERYIQTSTMGWVSLIAVIIISTSKLLEQPKGLKTYLLAYVNILYLAFLTLFYAFAMYSGAGKLEYGQPASLIQDVGRCISNYPISQDDSCLHQVDPLLINELAARRLTGFAKKNPVMLIAEDYAPEEVIIIDTGNAWRSMGIRDWLLADVPHDHLIHVAPEIDTEEQLSNTPSPLLNRLTAISQNSLNDLDIFVSASPSFWYVTPGELGKTPIELYLNDNYTLIETREDSDYQLQFVHYGHR